MIKLKKYFALLGIFLALSGCVSDSSTLAEGGIGGTGISVGPITGFGSIWQNGVRYDVSQASFFRDGTPVSGQNLYRMGEVVTINGTVQSDGVTGKASRVEFNTKLQGPISAVTKDSLTVLGQTVRLTGLTVKHGFALTSELTQGTMVAVSGERNANGIWQANSVTRQQAQFTAGSSRLIFEGVIANLNQAAKTFQIAGVTVNYQSAALQDFGSAMPTNQQYVQVRSEQNWVNNQVTAHQLRLKPALSSFQQGTKVELEGVVTYIISTKQFSLNQQAVQITDATELEHGSSNDIKPNAALEVEGSINALGILVAKQISIRQSALNHARELEGFISSIDTQQQSITLLGNTIQLDTRTVIRETVNDEERSISFAQLHLNDYVEIKASELDDGSLLALQLEREQEKAGEAELQVKGIATQINANDGTFEVLGVAISTDSHTEFEDSHEESISHQAFFSQLIAGTTTVEIEGKALGSGILAEQAKLVDTND